VSTHLTVLLLKDKSSVLMKIVISIFLRVSCRLMLCKLHSGLDLGYFLAPFSLSMLHLYFLFD